MRHACTLFVLGLHALVSMNQPAELVEHHNVREDVLLQIWSVIGALVIAGELTRRPHALAKSSIDFHMTSICLCAICNVALIRITCPAFGYCFILHAACSVAVSVVLDPACAFVTRVMAAFVIPITAFAVLLIPFPLEVASMVFFINHKTKAFHDTGFETGHLWGVLATSAVRAVVTMGYAVWNRL